MNTIKKFVEENKAFLQKANSISVIWLEEDDNLTAYRVDEFYNLSDFCNNSDIYIYDYILGNDDLQVTINFNDNGFYINFKIVDKGGFGF